MNIVTFEDVSKAYRMGEVEVAALSHVDLRIPKGAFTALVGPSGSGKTTVLNLIGCLDQPNQGEVTVAGRTVGSMDRRESAAFRGENLGFVFQDFNLLPVLTVFENVEYPLLMIRDWHKNQRKPAVDRVLDAVGMADQARKYPAQLSGGQKQRVAIARALVGSPALVLADEPTANLDSVTAEKLMDLMRRMNQEHGATFLMSTHDELVMSYAKRLVKLHDGRVQSQDIRG